MILFSYSNKVTNISKMTSETHTSVYSDIQKLIFTNFQQKFIVGYGIWITDYVTETNRTKNKTFGCISAEKCDGGVGAYDSNCIMPFIFSCISCIIIM